MCPSVNVGVGFKGSQSLIALLFPSAPLENVFGSSPRTHRLHRKRPVPSQRASGAFSLPALEEADAKEKEAFLALVGQMGTGHSLSE